MPTHKVFYKDEQITTRICIKSRPLSWARQMLISALAYFSALKTETCDSKTLACLWTTRCYNPENHGHHSHCSENIKFNKNGYEHILTLFSLKKIIKIILTKFWQQLTIYCPSTWHGPHRKWHLQQFFIVTGMCLPSRCLAATGRFTETQRLSLDRTQIAQRTNRPKFFYSSMYLLLQEHVYQAIA
jgi:hypothetical protein